MMSDYYTYFKSFLGKDQAKPESNKEVIFAKAPDEIKAGKQSSQTVSDFPTVTQSRPLDRKSLLRKYPALKKF